MQGPIKCCIIPETSAVWPHPRWQWHGFPLSGRRPVVFAYGDKWPVAPPYAAFAASQVIKWLQSPRMAQMLRKKTASLSRSRKQCFVGASRTAARFCRHLHISASSLKWSRNDLTPSTPSVMYLNQIHFQHVFLPVMSPRQHELNTSVVTPTPRHRCPPFMKNGFTKKNVCFFIFVPWIMPCDVCGRSHDDDRKGNKVIRYFLALKWCCIDR